MIKKGETHRLKRKASQEQAGSRKTHDAGKQCLFGGKGKQTAVGGKTVMSGSPTKLPGKVTPRVGDGNSNIKLTGTEASTPGGEGSSQIPGGTRSKIPGKPDGTALGSSRDDIANGIADGSPVACKLKSKGQSVGTAVRDPQQGIAVGIADDRRVGKKIKDHGQADGTAVGRKTNRYSSPNKLPGTVTPRRQEYNWNIKLPGTAASTPGGEGSAQIPGSTKTTATGILANPGRAINTSTGRVLENGARRDAESSLNARRCQVICANKRRSIALQEAQD